MVVHLVAGVDESLHSLNVDDRPDSLAITVYLGDSHEWTQRVDAAAAAGRSSPPRLLMGQLFWAQLDLRTPLAGRPVRAEKPT